VRSESFILSVVAVSATLASADPAAETRVVRHDDVAPSTRTLHVKPIPALGKREGANAALGTVGVARNGDVYLLSLGEKLTVYDPIAQAERDVSLEVPESVKGQNVAFFTFDTEGGVHVCYQAPNSSQSALVSYDHKGRVVHTRPLPVAPFLASGAVGPGGELYLSTLSPRGISGNPEKDLAPLAPVLVIDKDGSLKSTLGTWDQVEGNPAEVALRNLRIVLATTEGSIVLFRKDRFEFEVYRKNGDRVRTVSVDARDQRKLHLYENSKKEKSEPASSAAQKPEGAEDSKPSAENRSEATTSTGPPHDPDKKPRSSSRMKVDIPSVVRGVAVQGDRVYVLRNPYAYGGKEPRPAIDVFDSFGRWEEELLLDTRERFDTLAVGRDGSLYLLSAVADNYVWTADLNEQPMPPPVSGGGPH